MHYLPTNEASSFKESALDEHASRPTLAIGCIAHFESFPVHCKQSVPAGCTRLFYKMCSSHFPGRSELVNSFSVFGFPEVLHSDKAKTLKL